MALQTRRNSSASSAGTASTTTTTTARPPGPPQDVAILGGGLTGLVTAHYLAELLPATSRITLYEASDRLGGWIDSEAIEAADEDSAFSRKVILENGARMVAPQRNSARFDDLVFLDLVDRLNLTDALRVGDYRPAQYVYYPDHLVNVSMNTGLVEDRSLGGIIARAASFVYRSLTEPVFAGLLPSVLHYMVPSPSRAAAVRRQTRAAYESPSSLPPDESVGAFASRQLGAREGVHHPLVDNLLSAVMHGIYGGDVWRLSVASSPFRGSWVREAVAPLLSAYARQATRRRAEAARGQERDGDGDGDRQDMLGDQPFDDRMVQIIGSKYTLAQESDLSMLVDLLGGGDTTRASPRFLQLAEASTHWTQMGFADGFGTLTDALARRLVERENVTLRLGSTVQQVTMDRDRDQGQDRILVDDAPYDKVISTLASPALYGVTGGALPSLEDAHAVTIMVVNLYYAETGVNRPYAGFGYLIPQTVPLEENPEGALGVIFDSDRELAQRPLTEEEGASQIVVDPQAAPPVVGTKFTVMLGGHYWDQYGPEDYPTTDQAVAMAEAVVRRHLGTLPAEARPATARAKLCRGCIPQHYVGHATRLAATDAELASAFGGRLAVAGGSFTHVGPGVLPSLRSARDVALRVAGRGYRMPRVVDGRNETTMEHVGDTGLRRFGDVKTDHVSPVPCGKLPLRFGNGLGVQ